MKGLTMFATHMERAHLHHRQRLRLGIAKAPPSKLKVERTTDVFPMRVDRQDFGQHVRSVLVRANIVH